MKFELIGGRTKYTFNLSMPDSIPVRQSPDVSGYRFHIEGSGASRGGDGWRSIDEELFDKEALIRFRDDLSAVHADFINCGILGQIHLISLQGSFESSAKLDKMGHVRWVLEFKGTPSRSPHRIMFDSDQSYIPNLVMQLDQVIEQAK